MKSWDVIVLGAGPDALAAAGSLARRGKRVLVLERSERSGGLAAGRQIGLGCRTRGVLQDTSYVSPKLIRRLGLKTIDPPPVLGLQCDGPGLLLHRSAAAARDEVALHSARDADGYADWRAPEDDWRGERPNLLAYFDRLMERPAFAETAPSFT